MGLIEEQMGAPESADVSVVQPSAEEMATWPKRADGSDKGLGYFGVMKRPDGAVSSELSIGVNLEGREMEIPLIVPTLSRNEVKHLLDGGKPSSEMVDKAVAFAVQRMQSGQSPFAGQGEQAPLPVGGRGLINSTMVPNPRPDRQIPPPTLGGVRG